MPKCNLQAFLREISISIFGPFCSWVVFIFDIVLYELFVHFGDEFPVGILIANLSPYSEGWDCLTVRVSFGRQMVLSLMRSHFLICGLFFFILKMWVHKELAAFYVKLYPVYIFLKDFTVSILIFRYLYYLEFILYMVLGIFLISFSFSCLKEPSLCPP